MSVFLLFLALVLALKSPSIVGRPAARSLMLNGLMLWSRENLATTFDTASSLVSTSTQRVVSALF